MSVNIHGQVLDWRNKLGIEALEIEVWEKDRTRDGPVWCGETDKHGRFNIEFDELQSDIFFRIFKSNEQLHTIEESIRKNVLNGRDEVLIIVESTGKAFPAIRHPWLTIKSLGELFEHEQEILERIAETPNGGNLFMLHPFRFLADLDIDMSEEVRKELILHEPDLAMLSLSPYNALKSSEVPQHIQFHIKGLFRRR